MQGLPVILECHNLQSLDKALDFFIEFNFCESDFYFLNRSKNCMVATYNFGSVYISIGDYIYSVYYQNTVCFSFTSLFVNRDVIFVPPSN